MSDSRVALGCICVACVLSVSCCVWYLCHVCLSLLPHWKIFMSHWVIYTNSQLITNTSELTNQPPLANQLPPLANILPPLTNIPITTQLLINHHNVTINKRIHQQHCCSGWLLILFVDSGIISKIIYSMWPSFFCVRVLFLRVKTIPVLVGTPLLCLADRYDGRWYIR